MTRVVVAGVQGSAFYVLRLFTGTLVWAMVLHGLWDMSIFVQTTPGAAPSLVGALTWVAIPFALVGGFVVARRTQRGPVEDYAVGGAAHAVAPA